MLKKIITNDNSETFYNEQYRETYHSTSGAKEESVEKFVKPAKLQKLALKQAQKKDMCKTAEKNLFVGKTIKILDICFGLGYNSAAAIDLMRESNPNCRIFIVGLENDSEILSKTKEIKPDFKSYKMIKKASACNHYKDEKTEIILVLGDATQTVKNFDKNTLSQELKNIRFDAVFLDAFSPKKCPELWAENFLKDVSQLMKKGAILTTYSCATTVRKNLSNAGFKVLEGPCIGRRSPSLIAIKI